MAEAAVLDRYELVDSHPLMAAARGQVRGEAEAILTSRGQYWHTLQENYEEYFQPVDALSTAYKVLEAQKTHGVGSYEHAQLYQGLVVDCSRLIAEWYRKKRPEYFPPLTHVFDEATQEFYSHGLAIRQMTENAIMPIADNREEEARRVNERVEDATPLIVRRLGHVAMGGIAVRTISECTDKAIVDYEHDVAHKRPHRGYGGYVPEIEKLMIRDTRIDPVSLDRRQEQVGLPGTYITHFVIQKTLQRKGVNVADVDKTGLHGSQLLARDGLFDFVRELDETASDEWCTTVFMGEAVEPDHDKNYALFREQAIARQNNQTQMAETLAYFVLDLADDGFDRKLAPSMVEDFVKKLLLEIAKTDSNAAEQMFDRATAHGLGEVAYLESIGKYEQAAIRMFEVEQNAPGGGFCGAGSCGLEDFDMSGESGSYIMKKLKAETGDTVLKDTVRSCRCGSKGIYYAYNARKVTKFCTACGASESKVG